MGKGTGKRGPDPKKPTAEQIAQVPKLKERARRIHQFSEGINLLREAVTLARAAEEKMDAAARVWVQLLLVCGRTATVTLDEDAGSSPQEPLPRSPLLPETAGGSDPEIGGTPGIHLEAAHGMLRRACEYIRAAVDEAMEGVDVALPDEGVDHILLRLIEDDLGLEGNAAARLLFDRNESKMDPSDRRKVEWKLTHRALRRKRASKKVFEPAKTHFCKGFLEALEKHGVKFDPKLERLLAQEIRRAIVQATFHPNLDRMVGRVKLI